MGGPHGYDDDRDDWGEPIDPADKYGFRGAMPPKSVQGLVELSEGLRTPEAKEAFLEAFGVIVDFLPLFGSIKGGIEAAFGFDPVTGKPVVGMERVWSAIAALADVVGGGGLVAKHLGRETADRLVMDASQDVIDAFNDLDEYLASREIVGYVAPSAARTISDFGDQRTVAFAVEFTQLLDKGVDFFQAFLLVVEVRTSDVDLPEPDDASYPGPEPDDVSYPGPEPDDVSYPPAEPDDVSYPAPVPDDVSYPSPDLPPPDAIFHEPELPPPDNASYPEPELPPPDNASYPDPEPPPPDNASYPEPELPPPDNASYPEPGETEIEIQRPPQHPAEN